MRPGPLGRKVDTAGRRTSEGSVIQAKGVDGGGRTGKIDLLKVLRYSASRTLLDRVPLRVLRAVRRTAYWNATQKP